MSSPYVGKDFAAWYVAESTEGTTPTSPSWLPIAQHTLFDPTYSSGIIPVRQSGSVDLARLAPGVPDPHASIDYYPVTSAFLRSYISTDSTFSMILAPTNGAGGENASGSLWYIFKGCKIETTVAKAQVYPTTMPFSVNHKIWALTALEQATDPSPGTPSYTSFPTGALNWSEVTLTKAASLQTDWHDWSFTVANTLKRLPNPATGVSRTIKRCARTLTGTITRDFSDFAEYTDITAPNAFNVTFTLDSSHTVVLGSSQWDEFEPPVNVEDLINKRCSFKGLTLSTT